MAGAKVTSSGTMLHTPYPGVFSGPTPNPVFPVPPEAVYDYGAAQRDMASSSEMTFFGLFTGGEK